MKTAIPASGTNSNTKIDHHFGKCDYFFIFEDTTGHTEIVENPAKTAHGCKGDMIVKKLVEKDVRRIVAGDFGTIVQQLLNKHHIQMIIHPDDQVSVSDIIKLLSKKNNMPGMNHTGPEGNGPRTGRKSGHRKKASSETLADTEFELGKGMGLKRKSGGGQGKGRLLQSGKEHTKK